MFLDPLNRKTEGASPTESESEPEWLLDEPEKIQTLARLGMLNTPGDIESAERPNLRELARLVDEALEEREHEQVEPAPEIETAEDSPGEGVAGDDPDGPVVPGDSGGDGPDDSGGVPLDPDAGGDPEEDGLPEGVLLSGDTGGDSAAPADCLPDGDATLVHGEESGGDAGPPDRDGPGGGEPGVEESLPSDGLDLGLRQEDPEPGTDPGILSRWQAPGSDYPSARITERQAAWIAERLRVEDDLIACHNTGVLAEEVLQWRSDPAFSETVASYLTDKRGAFRPMAAHLLPLVWQVVHGLLQSPNPRDRKEGAKLALQTQGLLVNVQETTQSDELRRLLADMNRPVPVEIIDIEPRS